MTPSTEKFAQMSKSLLDQQLATTNHFFQHSAEQIGQLAEMNLQATRMHFEDAADAARELIDAKSPQEALELMMRHVQPNAEKLFSLSQHLMLMMANTQAELNKVMDEHMAEISRKSLEIIDDLSQQAPESSAPTIAAMKSAIQGAQTSYEQMTRSARAAAQVMDDHFSHLGGRYTNEVKASRVKKSSSK